MLNDFTKITTLLGVKTGCDLFQELGKLALLFVVLHDDPKIHSLIPFNMPIAVGSTAPDFTLKSKNADGLADVSLSDNGGKATVVLFFPLAFTGVCTQEFCDVTAGLSAYEDLNARVIGISVDSPFAQEAWAQANNISITLASDLNKETTKAYDVLFPMLAGVGDTSARAAFVVGADGVVKYAEQTPAPSELPNFDAIKAALAS
jgi:peroxiredoxin